MTAERFAAALAALAVPDTTALGVAVSGGPDSLALLLLAAQARPGQVLAATVDHGLRPEAAHEAEHVAAICRNLGVPHEVLIVHVEGSVQAGARAARYQALGGWCFRAGLGWLATAHHVDDQAETLLMRAARGSGVAGLAGVRRSRVFRPDVRLVRPLLDWRKSELEAIVDAADLKPVLDRSNEDPAYDRTAARALLRQTPWLQPERLAQSAANLADAEAALDWATDRAADEYVHGDSLDPSCLPDEIVRRLMVRLFEHFGESPRGPELARLIARLRAGDPGTLGRVKVTPGPRWTFAPAPPRRIDQ